jgi:hypothetical protein
LWAVDKIKGIRNLGRVSRRWEEEGDRKCNRDPRGHKKGEKEDMKERRGDEMKGMYVENVIERRKGRERDKENVKRKTRRQEEKR